MGRSIAPISAGVAGRSVPSDSKQVPEYLARRLGETYERFLKTAPSNSYAVIDKDGWHLSAEPTEKLDQEGQDRLAHLKSWLAKHMRRVKLPDLLIEVDNQLGFTRNFLTPAQREEPFARGHLRRAGRGYGARL